MGLGTILVKTVGLQEKEVSRLCYIVEPGRDGTPVYKVEGQHGGERFAVAYGYEREAVYSLFCRLLRELEKAQTERCYGNG